MIPLSKPSINKKDFKYVEEALNSNILTDGFFQNKVEQIIKKLIKSKYVALTQSCTSALEISALLINLKKICNFHRLFLTLQLFNFSSILLTLK